MVSLLVQRQQREAADRQQRLRMARQTASQISIQQTKSYQKQKKQQLIAVQRDAHHQWQQQQQQSCATIDLLLHRAEEHRGGAAVEASDFTAAVQQHAGEEAAAWRAESSLESARHRLAVAVHRSREMELRQPSVEAMQRRQKVREVERHRAAKVAAAPEPLGFREVLKTMQSPSSRQNNSAATSWPVPAVLQASRPAVATPADQNGRWNAEAVSEDTDVLRQRRWRLSEKAPQAAVVLQREAAGQKYQSGCSRGEEKGEGATAVAAARAQQTMMEERQAEEQLAMEAGVQRAGARASVVLLAQQQAERQLAREVAAKQARRAEIREVYRLPREEEENDAAAGSGDALPYEMTYRQQAEQQQRRAEEEFCSIFVEGPLVPVKAVRPPPQQILFGQLLKPAQLSDLLYETEAPPHHRWTSPPGSGAAGRGRWSQVLPSAPLVMRSLAEMEVVARSSPADPPPHAGAAGVERCTRPTSASASDAGAPLQQLFGRLASGVAALSEAEDTDDEAAVVSVEVEVGEPATVEMERRPQQDGASATAGPSTTSAEDPSAGAAASRSPSAVSEMTPHPQMEGRRVDGASGGESRITSDAASRSLTTTTPSDTSILSSISSQCSGTVGRIQRHVGAPQYHDVEASMSSDQSSTLTSALSSSVSTSASSYPMPTMTAEQLKLALIQLRSRMIASRIA